MSKSKKKMAASPLRGAEVKAMAPISQRVAREVDHRYARLATRVRKQACTTQLDSVRRGNIHETVLEETFNIDAVRKGRSARAQTGHGNGFANDRCTDLRVVDGQVVKSRAQVKTSADPKMSGLRLGKEQYAANDQLLVPHGQTADAQAALSEAAARNRRSGVPRKQKLAETQEAAIPKVDDKLRYGDVESKTLTVEQGDSLAQGNLDQIERWRQRDRLVERTTGAIKVGAAFGAVAGAVRHGKALFDGEETLSEAAMGVAKDTAVSAATSGATALTVEFIERGITRVAGDAIGGSMQRMGAVGAGLGVGINLVQHARHGTLTVGAVAEEVTTGALAWAGAEAGALCGAPLGPVGMAVGGLIGSAVAVTAVRPAKHLWRWLFG